MQQWTHSLITALNDPPAKVLFPVPMIWDSVSLEIFVSIGGYNLAPLDFSCHEPTRKERGHCTGWCSDRSMSGTQEKPWGTSYNSHIQ